MKKIRLLSKAPLCHVRRRTGTFASNIERLIEPTQIDVRSQNRCHDRNPDLGFRGNIARRGLAAVARASSGWCLARDRHPAVLPTGRLESSLARSGWGGLFKYSG